MLAISQILNVVADVLRRCCRCHVSTLTKSCCPPRLSLEAGRARLVNRVVPLTKVDDSEHQPIHNHYNEISAEYHRPLRSKQHNGDHEQSQCESDLDELARIHAAQFLLRTSPPTTQQSPREVKIRRYSYKCPDQGRVACRDVD